MCDTRRLPPPPSAPGALHPCSAAADSELAHPRAAGPLRVRSDGGRRRSTGFGWPRGRLVGRSRLCPRLSPGKTIKVFGRARDGPRGRAVPGLSDALDEHGYARRGGTLHRRGRRRVVSAIKRRAGVKDFTRPFSRTWGVLDRFDSLLVATPNLSSRSAGAGPGRASR